MVEQYKQVKYNSNKEKALKKSISSIVWTFALVTYFLVSFSTYEWHITWIIFPIAACIQSIIGLLFSMRAEDKYL